jgi:hypothetical protein
VVGDHDRRVLQALGSLELALGVDHLGTPLALGLGLARHRALHPRRDLDVLDLDDRDLDPPGRGRLVDDPLQDRVDLLAFGEELVELVLAQHRAQRRLRDLRGRHHEVLDLDDRGLRLDDPEVGDRIHAHRHVVLRDHFLWRDVERDRSQVDPDHSVDDWDQDEEAGALRFGEQPAEPEDDAAFVLSRDLDRPRPRKMTSRKRERMTMISAAVMESFRLEGTIYRSLRDGGSFGWVERLDVEDEIGSMPSTAPSAAFEEETSACCAPELSPTKTWPSPRNSPISPTIVCGPTETGLRPTWTALVMRRPGAPSTSAIETISQTLAW